jgi:membrane protease YdiL (CAAX protease family)
MKGLLKTKPALNQFLIFISITLASFFIFGLLGTMILGKITGMPLEKMVDTSTWDYNDPKIIFLLRGMQVVQFISLFVIPVFLCAWLYSTNTQYYLGLNGPHNKIYIIVGIAVMFLSIPLISFLGELNKQIPFPSGINSWMKKGEESAAKTLEGLLSRHTIKDLISNIICIAGLAAVGEELLFRGMAQRLLIKMFKSPWAGIIIAALLFSAIHMQFYGFIPRFVLGVLLGAMYWYSGSLWVAMLGHFIYDAFFVVLAYYKPEIMNDESTVKLSSLAIGAAISAVFVVLALQWMIKRSTVNYQQVFADDAVPVKDHPF